MFGNIKLVLIFVPGLRLQPDGPGRFPEQKKTTVMNTNFVKDIATIADALNGIIEFSNIEFDQCLLGEEYREKDVNNIVFVKKAYGVYFYTKKTAMEDMIMLKGNEMPVLVGCAESCNLYRISR